MRNTVRFTLFVVILLAVAGTAVAQNSPLDYMWMNYQGTIHPPLDSIYTVTFALYNESVGGIPLWTETQMVTTESGLFNAMLGSVTPFGDIWWTGGSDPKYLEVMVGAEILAPRTELGAVPASYATRRVNGDVVTVPGEIRLFSPDSNKQVVISVIDLGIFADGLWDGESNNEEFSINVQDEILSMDFSYDGHDRLTTRVDPDSTEFSMIAYDIGGDTTGSIVSTARDGALTQVFQAALNGEFRGTVANEIDDMGARTSYRWDDHDVGFVPMGSARIRADSTGSGLTLGEGVSDDDWILDLRSAGDHATMGLWQMDTEILALRADTSGGSLTIRAKGIDTVNVQLDRTGLKNYNNDGSLGMTTEGGGWTLYNPATGNPRGMMSQSGLSLYKANGDMSVKLDPAQCALYLIDPASGDSVVSFSGCGNSPLLVSKSLAVQSTLHLLDPTSGDTTASLTGAGNSPLLVSKPMSIGKMTAPMGMLDVAGGTPPAQYLITAENSNGNTVFEVGQMGTPLYGQVKIRDSVGQEQIRLSSVGRSFFTGGRLGIGTATPGVELEVSGDICASGTIGQCSDRRYKTDIHTVDGALGRIEQIRGVEFAWKQDEYPGRRFVDGKQIGFIAQELEDVIPEVVTEDDNGFHAVDYGRLTPLLAEAIKELSAQKDAEIAELQTALAEQQRQIDEMRTLLGSRPAER